MFDVHDFFGDIDLDDFRFLMTRDFVFIDYFNKYCFLPIFGQKVAFSKRKGRYIFDPQQERKRSSYTLSNDVVCNWLYKRRFPTFASSKVCDECKLCNLLMESPVYQAIASRNTEGMENVLDPREVLIARLGGVAKMAKFREFVSCSTYAKHLIAFWMDVEQLRKMRNTEEKHSTPMLRRMSPMLLRAIQNKYYRTTSRFFLTTKILGNEMAYGIGDEWRSCDLTRTTSLQMMVLEILRNYWVPKYVIALSKTSVDQPNMFPSEAEERKEKERQVKSMQKSLASKKLRRRKKLSPDDNEEENMLRYMLGRCSMVRFKATSDDQVKAIEFRYDDEEQNVLIQEVNREEEWSDTSTKLGMSEVDYIHHHFFSDDENKERATYRITQNQNDISSTGSALSLLRSSTKSLTTPEQPPSAEQVSEDGLPPPQAERRDSDDSSNGNRPADPPMDPLSPTVFYISNLAQMTYAGDRPEKRRPHGPPRPAKVHPLSQSTSSAETESGTAQTTDSSDANQVERYIPTVRPPDSFTTNASTTSSMFSTIPCNPQDKINFMSQNYVDVEDESEPKWDLVGHYQDVISEILISDELSGFVYRQFLAACVPISPSGDTATKDEYETEGSSLTCFMDYWKDAENFRRQHSSLSVSDLSKEHDHFLRRYFRDEAPGTFPQTDDLRRLWDKSARVSASKITDRLLEVQQQIQKNLMRKWIAYASEDRKDFFDSARPMVWKIGKRRSSYPSCPGEFRILPILKREVGDPASESTTGGFSESSDYKHDNEENLLLEFLGKKHCRRFKYRSSRAVYLLMMCVHACPLKYDATYGYYGNNYDSIFCAEVESDNDGAMMETLKRHIRLPDIDAKSLARMSAKEYPRHGIDYSKYKARDTTYRLIRKPLFMRPMTKGGVRIERPRERPKNFMEILKDPVHYMFFKRYMKAHDSEAPLLFWKSVDLLKRTESRNVRQRKAKGIMKKFFSRVAGGGVCRFLIYWCAKHKRYTETRN